MDAEKIRLEDVTKTYATEKGAPIVVLKGITATIMPGEFVSIIGPSGGGKSTLLHLIAGLSPLTSGSILVDGKAVTGPGRDRGMVFQQDAILMWRTVLENAEYGLELRGIPKRARREVARRYLGIVGMEGFADLYPKELSGGMKKRVQLAAVFANHPKVLLMDEPFGSLDYPSKISLQAQLQDMWLMDRRTTLFVTHDLEEALFLSDRVLALVDGRLARVYEVPLKRPRNDTLRVAPEFQQAKAALWEFLEPRPPARLG
jgi:ABC-type nitrate/sulfonate/bicarbonate transport system ATPase subunit